MPRHPSLLVLLSCALLCAVVSSSVYGRESRASNYLYAGESFRYQPNLPPIAVDDSYTVHNSVVIKPLLNDSDPDGDSLTASEVTISPTHGNIYGVRPGEWSYTANYGYTGTDTLTYRVYDPSGASATATVTLNVVNAPPVAVNDSYTVHNSVLVKPLINDSDPDGDSLSGSEIIVSPTHGNIYGVRPGEWSYTANYGYTGTDTLTYRVYDSLGATSTATVTLNVVNGAPVAVDDTYTVLTSVSVKPLLNDSDPEGDHLTITETFNGPSHGQLSGVSPGVYTYSPNQGYEGTDTFTYRVCDSLGACSTANVTLNVIKECKCACPAIPVVP